MAPNGKKYYGERCSVNNSVYSKKERLKDWPTRSEKERCVFFLQADLKLNSEQPKNSVEKTTQDEEGMLRAVTHCTLTRFLRSEVTSSAE